MANVNAERFSVGGTSYPIIDQAARINAETALAGSEYNRLALIGKYGGQSIATSAERSAEARTTAHCTSASWRTTSRACAWATTSTCRSSPRLAWRASSPCDSSSRTSTRTCGAMTAARGTTSRSWPRLPLLSARPTAELPTPRTSRGTRRTPTRVRQTSRTRTCARSSRAGRRPSRRASPRA